MLLVCCKNTTKVWIIAQGWSSSATHNVVKFSTMLRILCRGKGCKYLNVNVYGNHAFTLSIYIHANTCFNKTYCRIIFLNKVQIHVKIWSYTFIWIHLFLCIYENIFTYVINMVLWLGMDIYHALISWCFSLYSLSTFNL